MNKQPDNEAIVAKIADAEDYIKNFLTELVQLGATANTICGVSDSLRIISICYANELSVDLDSTKNLSKTNTYKEIETFEGSDW